MQKPPRRRPALPREVVLLYDDDSVAAVDKPAGLVAVSIKGSEAPSAQAVLAAVLKKRRQRVLIVHRIDRFSSGILLFAKTDVARDVLVKQFLAHTPVREYLTVVRGRVSPKEGNLVHHFRKDGMFQELRPETDSEAARAELLYKVERPLAGATLVRVRLVTGLQNQIRVQFSAAGHPVVGDRKYHPEEANEKRIQRVALHAAHMEFIHPVTRLKISVDSELPADMRGLVESLTPRRRS